MPDPVCPSGWSQEVVCSATSSGAVIPGVGAMGPGYPDGGATPLEPGCRIECYPPPDCPPGTQLQTVCHGGAVAVSVGVGGTDTSGSGYYYEPEVCTNECVPIEPYCPPGFEPQTVCEGGGVSVGGWPEGGVGGSSTSGGWIGGTGGAGGYGAVTTGGPMDPGSGGYPNPYPGRCWTNCVPVQPYCPPGTEPQTICGTTVGVGVGGSGGAGGSGPAGSGGWGAGGSDPGYSSGYTTGGGIGGMPTPSDCRTECVPVYCPPGTERHTYCYGSDTTVTVGVGGAGGAMTSGSGGWGAGGSGGAGTAGSGGWGAGGSDPGYSSGYTTGGGSTGLPTPSECWTDCVPVQPYCPPGTEPQTVCNPGTGPAGSGGAWGGDVISSSAYTTGGGIGGMPTPGECWTDCVPVQPYCPPGTEPQTFCSGAVGSGGAGPTGSGGAGGGMGGSGGWSTASTGGGYAGMPYPGECWTDCVPVQPYCPPGTVEQTICDDIGTTVASTGVGGMPYPGNPTCWTDCVPAEDACPPNMIERHICEETPTPDGGSYERCWRECVLLLP